MMAKKTPYVCLINVKTCFTNTKNTYLIKISIHCLKTNMNERSFLVAIFRCLYILASNHCIKKYESHIMNMLTTREKEGKITTSLFTKKQEE